MGLHQRNDNRKEEGKLRAYRRKNHQRHGHARNSKINSLVFENKEKMENNRYGEQRKVVTPMFTEIDPAKTPGAFTLTLQGEREFELDPLLDAA